MTFDELWPTLPIPGEYDAMDGFDRRRWHEVIKQAFEAGAEGKHFWCSLAKERNNENARLVAEIRRLRDALATLKERHD